MTKSPVGAKKKLYKATIKIPDNTERYNESTYNSIKNRCFGHASDPRVREKSGGTTLSTYFWNQIDADHIPELKWGKI